MQRYFGGLVDFPNQKTPGVNRFYQVPDGEDCLLKTTRSAGAGLAYGSIFAVLEMTMRSSPGTIPAMAARYVYWVAPAMALGAMYASTACLVGSLRKKNGALNHMIGGAAASTIIGARYGMAPGYVTLVTFALAAGFLKALYDNGGELFGSTGVMNDPDQRPILLPTAIGFPGVKIPEIKTPTIF